MADDLEIKRWKRSDKIILWAIGVMCFANLIIGLLTLGPDVLHW